MSRLVVVTLLVACAAPSSLPLVATALEPPGTNCAYGGEAIETGLDTNRNGVLDPSEITSSSFVCQPAPPQLVAISVEPPGAHCADGGQAIERGVDTNGNGLLDPAEVASTTYVCAVAGSSALVRVVGEPSGANCPNGGQAIESGVDTNGNGALDSTEVTTTSYVCHGAPTQLVSVTIEPAGAHCPDGGQAVRTGPDTNDNGVLDPTEVAATSYVCAMAGTDALVDVAAEPVGAHCPYGGQAVESGLDTNGNGLLDPAEVASTSYVCQAAPAELVDVTPEPIGANCAGGGQAIRRGLDSNRNGALDASEIATTTYVCMGFGASTLVRVTPEPPGAHCNSGGQAIATGLDTNNDGTLETAEVLTTTYACSGTNGMAALVRVDDASGTFCPGGGVAIDTGLDTNGDGILQNTEIQSTRLLCDTPTVVPTTLQGSFIVRNSFDVDALTGVQTITGDLWFQAQGLMSATFPTLQHIGGALIFNGFGIGGDVHFPALTIVDGDIGTIQNAATAAFPVLVSARSLAISDTAVSLPSLTSIGSLQATYITHDLSLPALTMAGDLYFSALTGVTVSAPLLTSAGKVYSNISLSADKLRGISELHMSGAVGAPTFFTSIPFPALTTTFLISISNNANLVQLSIPQLTTNANLSVDIRQNPKLPQCQALAIATETNTSPINITGNLGTCP